MYRAPSLEKKPAQPRSNYALTGLYFYYNQVCDFAADMKPTAHGELGITDLNKRYLSIAQLNVEIMGRGYACWIPAPTTRGSNGKFHPPHCRTGRGW